MFVTTIAIATVLTLIGVVYTSLSRDDEPSAGVRLRPRSRRR